jgi:hypothetical protein
VLHDLTEDQAKALNDRRFEGLFVRDPFQTLIVGCLATYRSALDMVPLTSMCEGGVYQLAVTVAP